MRLIFGKGKVSNIISRSDDIILSRSDCDISNYESVNFVINKINPDTVINCAAKTNLEYCQINRLKAYRSNTLGAINLLDCCARLNVKLVHISSGCLFDGNQMVSDETTITSPSVWYTRTKDWADDYIQNFGYENYLILRPRQLISKTPHPSNMITKFASMLKIPAIDEDNSLTCIEDFGEMIDHLLSVDASGIFNCSNTGTITPYEIANRIKDTINSNLIIERISYDGLLEILPNKRVNTILSCDKLIKSGYIPRSAHDALDWCLKNYGR